MCEHNQSPRVLGAARWSQRTPSMHPCTPPRLLLGETARPTRFSDPSYGKSRRPRVRYCSIILYITPRFSLPGLSHSHEERLQDKNILSDFLWQRSLTCHRVDGFYILETVRNLRPKRYTVVTRGQSNGTVGGGYPHLHRRVCDIILSYHTIVAYCHIILSYIILSYHTIISYYHIILSYHTIISYYHIILSHHTIISYYHIILSYQTIISYYHIILSYHTIISYYHITLSHHTIKSYYHIILSHHTIISYYHIILSYHTIISYYHIMLTRVTQYFTDQKNCFG